MGFVTADTVTYNALMRSCQTAKQWPAAMQLMHQMGQKRLVKDEISYTTALSGGGIFLDSGSLEVTCWEVFLWQGRILAAPVNL